MWRKGFTFKVQTPHLKFGSWNDSRVSTVFLVWTKPNILWIRLRPTLEPPAWPRLFECFILHLSSVIAAVPVLLFSLFCPVAPLTLIYWKTHVSTSGKLTLTHFFALMQRRQLLLLSPSVWFSSVFGLAFLRFAIQLFVFGFLCLSFFCQDSLFLYLIKIWKLNFHSIFSNHLIKISSTTTKKIRSSCSK